MVDRDYVLGTHDDEIARLDLQNRVWRCRVREGWSRAGFGRCMRIMDVGAGPGFATLDLADLVGPEGSVVAVERSARFLERLRSEAARRNLRNVEIHEADLDDLVELPASNLDGIWCRWILAFVRQPRPLVNKIVSALKPGGTAVLHEYLDYASWRLMPPVPSFEEFVSAVMASWREQGGEPDIARSLPGWFEDAGAQVVSLRPIVEVVTPADEFWQWPAAFVYSGLDRLVEIGRLDAARADTMRAQFAAASVRPGVRMVTPMVLELVIMRSWPRSQSSSRS
jgi:SAM-dependent methyltransferase